MREIFANLESNFLTVYLSLSPAPAFATRTRFKHSNKQTKYKQQNTLKDNLRANTYSHTFKFTVVKRYPGKVQNIIIILCNKLLCVWVPPGIHYLTI